MKSSLFHHAALGAALSAWLLACGDDADPGDDAATDGGASSADAGAADAGTCSPIDCKGMPVPEIACADGPTEVSCARSAGGACRVMVGCGASDAGPADAGANDAAASDAGADAAPPPVDGEGATCGGIAGRGCASAALFCDYSEAAGGTGCGTLIADGSGTCAAAPQICPELYAPVCGCDRHSYASACHARSARVGVLHDGLCTAEECTSMGGTPKYSDGASTPTCAASEQSFAIPGKEPAVCCYFVLGP